MCGIVGVAGHILKEHEKAFSQMLIFDSVRGIDSTGVAAVAAGERDSPSIIKAVGDPFLLMEMDKFNRVMRKNLNVLLGHNRFATVGKVTRNTAHPFEFNKVVGVHNGTLQNKWELLDGNNFDVDSQALYNSVDKLGIEVTAGKLAGAWSLVWWDKEQHNLSFLRNEERPMFIGKAKKTKTILWASERWMIEIAAARNNIELEEVFSTKTDKLYVYGFDGNDFKQLWTKEGVEGKKNSNIIPLPRTASSQTFTSGNGTSTKGKVEGNAGEITGQTVNFFVNGVAFDEYGATYCQCIVEGRGAINFRWYMHKNDKGGEQYRGKRFTGVVGKLHLNHSRPSYYKIDYGSVKMVRASTLALPAPVVEEETFLSSSGRYLSRSDWVKQHGECCWCGGGVLPEIKHTFFGTESICWVCSSDKEVLSIVRG